MTATDERRSRRARGWLRLGASLVLLVAALWLVDARELGRRLLELEPAWALAALLTHSLQFFALAARWWLIARWLGVPLGYREAVAEYYLSALLNQVLPLGVFGDALRLVRHAGRVRHAGAAPSATARVALALVLDRASGQLALWLTVVALTPEWYAALAAAPRSGELALWSLALAVALAVAVWFARRRWAGVRTVIDDGLRVLLSPRRLLLHLSLSALLVSGHVASFALVARALGFELAPGAALRIVPPVLVAATLPGFFAGWGAREAAAAGLYYLSGLRPADGAMISLVWGTLGLLSSAPGLVVWWRGRGAVNGHGT